MPEKMVSALLNTHFDLLGRAMENCAWNCIVITCLGQRKLNSI